MVFPVVVSECESWTIKKVERQRIHAFALWFWRRLLRVPLDCKEIKPVNPKGNQSWIFIGRTDAEAEPLILWPPNLKSWLIRKDPNAGKDWGEGDDRGWGGWMILLTWWSWVWASSGRWWRTGKPGVLQPMVLPRVGQDWATEQQQQQQPVTQQFHFWVHIGKNWKQGISEIFVRPCFISIIHSR